MNQLEKFGSKRITRRNFVKGILIATAGFAVAKVERVFGETRGTQAVTGGKSEGMVEIKPAAGWPWAPSFSKYTARARFSDSGEAVARIRSRRFPVELRRR
jgi:hypothetical protein